VRGVWSGFAPLRTYQELVVGQALLDGRVVAGDLDGQVGGPREWVHALQDARYELLLHRGERHRGEPLERVPLGHGDRRLAPRRGWSGVHWSRGGLGPGLASGRV
jgi:hypothetical protein